MKLIGNRAAVAGLISIGALLCGCGGGSGAPGSDNSLQGVLTVDRFVLPMGQTRMVSVDTEIKASDAIQIDGTLLVAEGASLTLIGQNSVTINGEIKPAPGKSVRSVPITRVPRSSRVDSEDTSPKYIVVGSEVVWRGSLLAGPGADVYVACFTQPKVKAQVELAGKIGTLGEDSTSRDKPGKRAGDIEIGTARAIGMVKQSDAAIESQYTVGGPDDIIATGQITAGRGGNGFTDSKGKISGRSAAYTGTDGGNGGSISMDAYKSVDVHLAAIKAGDGGDGGGAGSGRREPDGDEFGGEGYSVGAVLGSGGNGGSVTYGKPDEKIKGKEGTAGTGGSVRNFSGGAGNGGAQEAGGNASIEVGVKGVSGTGPKPALAQPQAATITIVDGGNGGDSSSKTANGGHGGSISIFKIEIRPVGVSAGKPDVAAIAIGKCSAGGKGFIGCSESPQLPGTHGGNGGSINTLGAAYTKPDDAFHAGDGGDGTIAGLAGKPGMDENNKAVGRAGKPGSLCSGGSTGFLPDIYIPRKLGDKRVYDQDFGGGFVVRYDATIEAAKQVPDGFGGSITVIPEFKVSGTAQSREYLVEGAAGPTALSRLGTDSLDSQGGVKQWSRFKPSLGYPWGSNVGETISQSSTLRTMDAAGNQRDALESFTETLDTLDKTVTVEAGTYIHCAQVTQNGKFGALDLGTTVFVFAPNVGLVWSQTTQSGIVSSTTQLFSYTPGRAARQTSRAANTTRGRLP